MEKVDGYLMYPKIISSLNLSANEIKFYIYILDYVSYYKKCLLNIEMLSFLCKISKKTIYILKKKLSLPRDELGGLSLIRVEERYCENGGRLPDEIFITDLRKVNQLWIESVIP
ncbi:MAG TPA: hypothetical protein VMX17_05175 [Candidatus Glassbacteria bacterium]|nr:hypothetical protein [Candidatus Glassbacteria bacterium]